ncbi:hypothetical protein Glove_62g18 [Diversispora epigaea]|uniref:F-box domain-containing protein n=1 Tax=Diversispora epigaea TaxID=1348612 RepID=A0A397JCE3_9GLOM|nr:hypothetical protein Glove_62g18 [Diversispora epigaea]
MSHSRIFSIPEVLEQILYFLLIDKSLYPALYVSQLWYSCGAPILWKRIELNKNNIRKIFMKIIRDEHKPVYCLNVTHLGIPNYHSLSDKKFKAESHSNLKYLNLAKGCYSGLITDKDLYAIANSCHKLEYPNISNHKEISEIAI